MNKPTFIISYDCEGKWGVADILTKKQDSMLSSKNLLEAYSKLSNLHDRYQIRATWAFVGLMTMSFNEFKEKPWSKEGMFKGNKIFASYLKNYYGQNDGWFIPEAVKLVINGNHELASHGFSHCIIDPADISATEFQTDLKLIKKLDIFKNQKQLTYVYPRNIVNHTEELKKAGFIGYRGQLCDWPNKLGPCGRLLGEFNCWEKPQAHSSKGSLIRIPSGYFLNWRKGIRSWVPLQVTKSRWKKLLNNAIKKGNIIHLWSHPHNFIDGTEMYNLLEFILSEASQFHKSGDLSIMTMKEYASSCLSGT